MRGSELEANIVPSATGADGFLAAAGPDVGQAATDAGKGRIDAAVVREEHVASVVPRLQSEQDDRGQPGQEGQEGAEVDGDLHGREVRKRRDAPAGGRTRLGFKPGRAA